VLREQKAVRIADSDIRNYVVLHLGSSTAVSISRALLVFEKSAVFSLLFSRADITDHHLTDHDFSF
jgi:hypothetical protein